MSFLFNRNDQRVLASPNKTKTMQKVKCDKYFEGGSIKFNFSRRHVLWTGNILPTVEILKKH
jgi:hypothetical protein